MEIKIYGSRGTLPFSWPENANYGGNTACVKVQALGQTLLLDCGSGLARFQEELNRDRPPGEPVNLSLLISHLHLDHIIGLTVFSPLYEPNQAITIYTKSRSALPLAQQVFGAFKPPYWPIPLAERNQAQMVAIRENEPFELAGGIKITPFAASHHDQTIAFRVEADKTLVYLLDYEIGGPLEQAGVLEEYCRGADLIIFDSAYLPEDYPRRRGWGHSTYAAGMGLARRVACPKMLFCHLSYEYVDHTLEALAGSIPAEKFLLAYDGMELTL